MERKIAYDIVVAGLRAALEQTRATLPADTSDDTVLVGKGAVLDSLGVVSLIVEVEQLVEQQHSVSVTLADDKAMSQKNSPFRTIGALVDHVIAAVKEAA